MIPTRGIIKIQKNHALLLMSWSLLTDTERMGVINNTDPGPASTPKSAIFVLKSTRAKTFSVTFTHKENR